MPPAASTGYVAGGLVGYNFGDGVSLVRSSSPTPLAPSPASSPAASLATITAARSAGPMPPVLSQALTRGLVSINSGGTTDSYWDTETSGQPTSAGGIGLTTRQLQALIDFRLDLFLDRDQSRRRHHIRLLRRHGRALSLSHPLLPQRRAGGVRHGADIRAERRPAARRSGVYSGGTLLTSVTTSAGANGYFYEIVAAGTLAGNAKLGATLTLAGAGSVSRAALYRCGGFLRQRVRAGHAQ